MMRKALFSIVVAAACLVAAPIATYGADIAKPVYKAPAVVPAYNWTGFYIGGSVGYAWGDFNTNDPTGLFFQDSSSLDGWLFGGQLGYNWQAVGSPWVWGIEFDSQWMYIKDTITPSTSILSGYSKFDYFGTLRARLGYAWDRVMWYATGGLAWGSNEIGFNLTPPGPFAAERNTHIGWTVGGGVEWAWIDNWTVKAEYLYVKLDSEPYFQDALTGFDADMDVHTFKVGLNYRFGYYGYGKSPVAARY